MKHGTRGSYRTSLTVCGAFFLSFLLFGSLLLIGFFTRQSPTPETVVGKRGVQRSAWVVLHDEQRLTGLVQVITDTRTMTVQAVGYPPQTEMTDGVLLTTAAKQYAAQGALPLEGTTLYLSMDAVAILVSELSGNLPITLSETVGTLPAGTLTLTPLQVTAVMMYNGWRDEEESARVHAVLTAEFINRVLKRGTDLEDAFGSLVRVCRPRLHITQFEMVRGEWEALAAEGNGGICTARVAEGYPSGVGEERRYVVILP